VASELIEGYNYQKGSAIAVPIDEHRNITTAQLTNGIARFRENPTAGDLIVRDFFLMKKYTQAPPSQLDRLLALIKTKYPGPVKWK